MIKCVNIHSYKLLNNLSLESFGHFNIFTGRNNVGKTSVLEAIYLNTWDESPMENLIKVFDKFRNFRLNKSSAEFLFIKEIWILILASLRNLMIRTSIKSRSRLMRANQIVLMDIIWS